MVEVAATYEGGAHLDAGTKNASNLASVSVKSAAKAAMCSYTNETSVGYIFELFYLSDLLS